VTSKSTTTKNTGQMLVILIAMRMRRCDAGCIAQWSTSCASLEGGRRWHYTKTATIKTPMAKEELTSQGWMSASALVQLRHSSCNRYISIEQHPITTATSDLHKDIALPTIWRDGPGKGLRHTNNCHRERHKFCSFSLLGVCCRHWTEPNVF